MEECSECEPEEMEPPAKRSKLVGAKAVPESWATTPPKKWPGASASKKGVLYYDDEGKYWLCNDGNRRRPVCSCKPEGKCGLMAQSTTRPGFALVCALREDRKERYLKAKEDNGGKLPDWKGGEEHKGEEVFVLHRGRECVTRPCDGQALPLCGCGVCFKACNSFKREYADGCIKNPGAKCECGAAARKNGCCKNCAVSKDVVAKRKEEREPELLACMEKYGIERAPDDANYPAVKSNTPYVQQNHMADYAPRIVVRVSSGNRGFVWAPCCTHVGDDGTLCAQLAQSKMGGPIKCKQHGGGHRCVGFTLPGSDPEPCPYDISIDKGGKYGNHCVKCFCATNPNTDLAKAARQNYQAKEHEVRLVLERAFPNYRWTFDRAFAVGVRQRPDAKVVVGDRVLIVEVDEFSHHLYGCHKERERERIFVDYLGKNRTVVMVRFNPDKYVDPATGKKMPSCFRKSGEKDLVSLDPKQAKQWKHRCDALIAWVRSILDPTCDTYCETIPPREPGRPLFSQELFYDNPMTEKAKREKIEATQRAQHAKKKRKAEE